jgi:hypothetical protein
VSSWTFALVAMSNSSGLRYASPATSMRSRRSSILPVRLWKRKHAAKKKDAPNESDRIIGRRWLWVDTLKGEHARDAVSALDCMSLRPCICSSHARATARAVA